MPTFIHCCKTPRPSCSKKTRPQEACNTSRNLFHLQYITTNISVEVDWESLSILSQIICFRSVIWRISLRERKCFSFIFHSIAIIHSKSKVATKNRSLLYFETMGNKLRKVCFSLPLTWNLYNNIKILNNFKVYV